MGEAVEIARILSTASVRVEVDVRRAERDAERAGEQAGRAYAKGADREVQRTPIRPKADLLAADFERQVRAALNKIAKTASVNIPLTAAGERFRAQVSAQIAEVERTLKAEIPADPESAAEFRVKLARMVRDASRGVDANIDVNVGRSALSRMTRFFRSLFGLGGRATGTFASIAGSGARMGGVLGKVFGDGSSSAATFGGSMTSMAVKVGTAILSASAKASLLAAGLGLVAGAALTAVGAVTSAVAGLPVVLSTVAAPIAAIVIGFDGISRAAGVLKPKADELARSLNTLAENVFIPVFKALEPVFPVLQRGLEATIVSVAAFARGLVGVVTSAEGLGDVERAIRGAWRALDGIRPSAERLLKVFLAIAGTSELYQILSDTIGGMVDRFAAFLERLRLGGLLTESLTQLRDVLLSASDAVFALAEGAVRFFNQAGPGLAAFFDGLTAMIRNIPFEAFGASFGQILASIGDGLARIPPETWAKLAIAVQFFADSIQRLVDSGALNAVIGLFAQLVISAGYLTNALGFIIGPITSFLDKLGFIGPQMDGTKTKFDELNAKTTETGGYFDTLTAKLGENTDVIGQKALTTGGYFDELAVRIGESTGVVVEKSGEMAAGFGANMDQIPAKGKVTMDSLAVIIGTGMGTAAGTMIRLAAEAVTGTGGWLGRLPGMARMNGVTAALHIQNAFGALRDSAVRLSREAAVGAITNIYTIPDRLSNLKDILFGVGSAMIQGLINGIKSMATRVAAAAVEVVTSAIKAAKSAIRAGSPSLVWRGMGVDTIRGYILGLQEQVRPLLEQVRGMFAQATAEAQAAGVRPSDVAAAVTLAGGALSSVIGSATGGNTARELAAMFADLHLTARFDGPNVIQIVADGNRKLAMR